MTFLWGLGLKKRGGGGEVSTVRGWKDRQSEENRRLKKTSPVFSCFRNGALENRNSEKKRWTRQSE